MSVDLHPGFPRIGALARAGTPKPDLPSEFDRGYLGRTFTVTPDLSSFYSWDLLKIRNVRALHMSGDFSLSGQLAAAMKWDGAIYASLLNRIAPPMGLPRRMVGSDPQRGEGIRRDAEATFAGRRSLSFSLGVMADIFEDLAMDGFQISQNIWTPSESGGRLNVRLEPWPIEYVQVDPMTLGFVALTSEGREPILHGHGKWVVSQRHHTKPWRWGAIIPLAGLWPDRAFGQRDRSQNAEAHGQAKPIGTLPENIPIDSPEGRAMIATMQRLQHARSGMLKPYGVELEYLESSSQAWQIFREIITSDNSDIAKILLGQDGTVNNSGGNYIKSDVLFGVRNDIVEGDLRAVEAALSIGTLRPWTAVNFGRVEAHPTIEWLLPDVDEDARITALAGRTKSFNESITMYRANGCIVDQDFVNLLAAEFNVPPPALAEKAPSGADLFQYDLELGIVTINEARERKGLPPVTGGERTVPEAKAQAEAEAARSAQMAPGGAP